MSFVEIYPEMIIRKCRYISLYLHMYVCMLSIFTEIDFIIENILNISCKESSKRYI